jgi:hypothetical protein
MAVNSGTARDCIAAVRRGFRRTFCCSAVLEYPFSKLAEQIISEPFVSRVPVAELRERPGVKAPYPGFVPSALASSGKVKTGSPVESLEKINNSRRGTSVDLSLERLRNCEFTTMKRRWTDEDISSLKSMARRYPTEQIAKALARGVPATVMMAHSLRISLRLRPKKGSGVVDLRDPQIRENAEAP